MNFAFDLLLAGIEEVVLLLVGSVFQIPLAILTELLLQLFVPAGP